jgi:hypothetical protein
MVLSGCPAKIYCGTKRHSRHKADQVPFSGVIIICQHVFYPRPSSPIILFPPLYIYFAALAHLSSDRYLSLLPLSASKPPTRVPAGRRCPRPHGTGNMAGRRPSRGPNHHQTSDYLM